MQIVIDIPEEIYKASKIINVKYEDIVQIPLEVIANGTPIPDNATVCDIDAIKKRIKYEANVLDIKKGFAYCSGYMDAFRFALDIIDKYTKGDKE